MKIVIDISNKVYVMLKYFEEAMGLNDKKDSNEDVKTALMRAVVNGTPLPEHHGRLIDADELYGDFIDGTEGYDCQTWNRIEIGDIIEDAPTIIEGSENV